MEPKYGIIGCGYMSQYYFDGLKELGAKISYVADIDMSRAEKYAEKFNCAKTTNYIDVINDRDVNTVIVLAHAGFHKEICLAAINAGKNVICEKTLSNNAQEAHEIASAAKNKKVLFFTAYMKRFFPASKKAKELTNKLGHIYSIHARSYQYWGNLYDVAKDFSDKLWLNNYGGGVLKCAGSHILDLILFFMGRPESVSGTVDYVPGSKLDRKATVILKYSNGATASFETAGHSLKKIGYQRNGWDEKVEISGTKGRIELFTTTWNKPEECAALLTHYDDETETYTEYRFDAINNFKEQVKYFHECICNNITGHPDVIDGYNVDVLISSIMDSSAHNKVIKIDWMD